MPSLTTTRANAVLNQLVADAPWVALYTVMPTASTPGTEVAGGAYTRVQATFSAAAGGTITTSTDTVYPDSTAAWGTIVGVGLHTAQTGATLQAFGTLSQTKTLTSGDVFRLRAGEIDITAT